jgi:hypothetical protein
MKSFEPAVVGVVEQGFDELAEQSIVELSAPDLAEVGGGACDPGVIEIEK